MKNTILYVDDEAINLELFKITFKNNYNIFTSLSGFEGLEIIENSQKIDAIISDMQMPGMHGVDFIKKIKEKFPEMPCFILTGYDINEEISNALTHGLILKYFQKPMNIEEINANLKSVL